MKKIKCSRMTSIEDSVTALPERRSIEDIKKSYPDEWILVGNHEKDERDMEFRTGIVLYHSPDKRELAYRDIFTLFLFAKANKQNKRSM